MTIKELSLNEIKKLIPHREPMLLIDKVKIIKPFISAIGIKKIKKKTFILKAIFQKNLLCQVYL